MGLIVRTAGLSRTKTEIKRDFDYLARLWDEIRKTTLASTAPSLIHSDSDLIKRAIRDIYNREIEEVVVEGEEGYKSAKAFMKMLMPSHARRVKAYSDPVPLFQRYGAEDQLRAMYDPMVQLKSGGYLIINPTEALVSIDINSGRSTKEHGIEQTALHTNLEAAREIARQLRLRDMAGLVVIDFIDMEYNSNTRKVEKAMKEALKNDRARIQVGRISSFGLMEMSRQRLRTGVLEATTRPCPHCDGTGLVRTASSAGLSALRLIEDEAAKAKGTTIKLAASTEAAFYLLNEKRGELVEIEERYGVTVEVSPEGEDEGAKMNVSSAGPRPTEAPKFEPIIDDDDDDDLPEEDLEEEGFDGGEADEDDAPRKKKRRRRRGGRGRNKKRQEDGAEGESNSEETEEAQEGGASDSESEDGEEKPKRRRRRGGRGRRRKSAEDAESVSEEGAKAEAEGMDSAEAETAAPVAEEEAPAPEASGDVVEGDAPEEAPKEKPKRKRAPRKKKAEAEAEADADTGETAAETPPEAETEEKPKRKRAQRKKKAEEVAEAAADDTPETVAEAEPQPAPEPEVAPEVEASPEAETAAKMADDTSESSSKKRGWWQRTFGE